MLVIIKKNKKNHCKIIFAEVKVESKFKVCSFTRIGDENPVDEVDDTIGGDNVLLQYHLNAIDCQAVSITADLYGAALGRLKHRPCHDCF